MPLFRTLSTSRATLIALTKLLSLIHLFVPLPSAYASASQKARITTTAFKSILLPPSTIRSPMPRTMLFARQPIASPPLRRIAMNASMYPLALPRQMPRLPLQMAEGQAGANANDRWRLPVGFGVGAVLAGTLAMLTASYASDEVVQQSLQTSLNQEGPLEYKAMAILRHLERGKQSYQHAGEDAGEDTYLLKLRTSEHYLKAGQTSRRTVINEEDLKAALVLIQAALSKGNGDERPEFFNTVAYETAKNGVQEEWLHIYLRTKTSDDIAFGHAFSWHKLTQQIKAELAALQRELSVGWSIADSIVTPPMQYYFEEEKKATQSLGPENTEALASEEVVIKHSMQPFQEDYKSTIFLNQLRKCGQNIVYGLQSRPTYPFPYVRIEVAGELDDLQQFKKCMTAL